MDKKLTHAEAVELFWKSEAPLALSNFCNGYRVLYYPELPPVPLAVREDQAAAYDFELPPHEVATFFLDGKPFGDGMYLAVTCQGHVIVPPFPIHLREQLPTMQPVKEAQNAPTTRAARPTHADT